MIDTVDLRSIRQPTADDPAGLNGLLQQIVGQPFLFFRRSYADEMTLHIGAPREYASPKLKGQVRGSYVLTLRGSLWQVESQPAGILAFSVADTRGPKPSRRLNLDDLLADRLVKPGTPVERAAAYPSEDSGGYVLFIGFADGSRLAVRPEKASTEEPSDADDPLPEIADWELLTPYGRYLRVGPGAEWSYLPSGR